METAPAREEPSAAATMADVLYLVILFIIFNVIDSPKILIIIVDALKIQNSLLFIIYK